MEKLLEGEMPRDPRQQRRGQVERIHRPAFAETLPERGLVAFLQEVDRLRQPEKAALLADELQAEAVDGAEKRPAQIGEQVLPPVGALVEVFEHEIAGADAELLGGELAVGHHHQAREDVSPPGSCAGRGWRCGG